MRRCPRVVPRTAGGGQELLPRPCTTGCVKRPLYARGVRRAVGASPWTQSSVGQSQCTRARQVRCLALLVALPSRLLPTADSSAGKHTRTPGCAVRAVRSCNQPSARSTPWCAREDRAGRRAAQSRVRVRPKPSGGRVEHTDCKSRRSLSCFVSTGLRGLSGGREVAERGAADSLSSLHEVQPPVRFTPRVRKRSTRGTQGCEIQTHSIVSVCTKRSIVNLDFELLLEVSRLNARRPQHKGTAGEGQAQRRGNRDDSRQQQRRTCLLAAWPKVAKSRTSILSSTRARSSASTRTTRTAWSTRSSRSNRAATCVHARRSMNTHAVPYTVYQCSSGFARLQPEGAC